MASDRMSDYPDVGSDQTSGWAVGGAVFAATVMLTIGAFQIIAGISAIADDKVFVATANYTFGMDVTQWGWIHLIIGIIMVLTGVFLFLGRMWAAVLAIAAAVISAIENFLFLPYYPFWSIVIIALNMWVIWALTRPGITRS